MSARKSITNRIACYPMVGPVEKQFSTLLDILHKMSQDTIAQSNFVQWMQTSFKISNSFARKVCSYLFIGTGLVTRKDKKYTITKIGQQLMISKDADVFYRIFSKTFFGLDNIIQILADKQPTAWEPLRADWLSSIRSLRTEPSSWSEQHISSQLRFRVDWLRSLGFIDFITGKYYLSKKGFQLYRTELESTATSTAEREVITHNDIENKLGIIGAFFQFNVRKRANLNDILPKSSKLMENRQVDSLWVRFVHFGGKLQYPFEIQLSGSMADAIERLEMVANVVQKAVVVTDAKQKEKMLDRLKVKRSPLLDKIVFLEPEEVDKIVEATLVMKSFTESLFSEKS